MEIKVRSRQKNIDEAYTQITYQGNHDFKAGKHFIRYTETLEENAGDVRTLIKVHENQVQVTRSGAITSQLTFIEGENVTNVYPTAYGNFDADIFTRKIRVKHAEDLFVLKIFYDLSLNGAFISECEFEINIPISE